MESFANKLEYLITQSGISPEEIARHIGISRVALWKLRTGRVTNPGIDTVQALCKFFRIEANFFFDIDPDATKASDVVDQYTQKIAMRTKDMDNGDKEFALGMLDYIRSYKSSARPGQDHEESKPSQ